MLQQQGLANSREMAKRMIMAGQVYQLQREQKVRIQKPGQILPDTSLLWADPGERFVSRGGEKLLTALEEFDIRPVDKVCLDVGASTGGFTDCLLQLGALRVYALDVGSGQLDWKLRQDCRVINLEKVNIRKAQASLLPEKVGLATIDCSFISLTQVLPAVLQYLSRGSEVIALVKPQFEAGRQQAVKGVVKSLEVVQQAVQKVGEYAERELGLEWVGQVPSRIQGPKGNQEYLIYLRYIPE